MKICVLTHELHTNYGGLLQAYALQTVLKRMGYDVVTDKGSGKYIPFGKRILLFLYHFGRRYIGGSIIHDPFQFFFYSLKTKRKKLICLMEKNTVRFINKHISTIDFFNNQHVPSADVLAQFDVLIVGSDQVWRPLYKYVPTYFLDFTKNIKIKRIAYAASFGVDNWDEFTPKITTKCTKAAKLFDAISVREDSAVELCQKHLGVYAEHLLDPTLLLEKEDYLDLIEAEDRFEHKDVLMCYMLDQSSAKKEFIQTVSKRLMLTPLEVKPDEPLTSKIIELKKCIYPSVSKWISGFRDAKFVLTDSFHGTVFAIIFNKPFIAISNSKRGATRFTSLLHIFGLEYRLLSSFDELSDQYLLPIDYSGVNHIKKQWQEKSLRFLKTNLSI